ncbi:unnamed protein product [Blumeria hordei]|uniref:Uncharacterized protein n=1 Tax=Blumeria hordei TaxID=2867405 RepID=A0A383UZ74_BLUHO|nr:unnamed protein product [Blumeria hordei]
MRTSILLTCLGTWLISVLPLVQCAYECTGVCMIETHYTKESSENPLYENRKNYPLPVDDSIKDLAWRDLNAPDECLSEEFTQISYEVVYRPDGKVHSIWMIKYYTDAYERTRCYGL